MCSEAVRRAGESVVGQWKRNSSAHGPHTHILTWLSARKGSATVFWDSKGVLLINYLIRLSCHLLDVCRLLIATIRNPPSAGQRTATVTCNKLTKLHLEPLVYQPYSPDLYQCDWHTFGPLKETLVAERFDDDTIAGSTSTWTIVYWVFSSFFFHPGIKISYPIENIYFHQRKLHWVPYVCLSFL